jgi:hypothetical protein
LSSAISFVSVVSRIGRLRTAAPRTVRALLSIASRSAFVPPVYSAHRAAA